MILLLLDFFKRPISEKEATITFKVFRHEMQIFESLCIRVSSHNNLHHLILTKEKPETNTLIMSNEEDKKENYFESLHSA